MQRIGRAGHTIGAASRGVIVPKFRGDLVACAAVTRAMHEARIESTRYPRNPLDVLAQQIVAMVSMDAVAGRRPVRRACGRRRRSPSSSRGAFEGVLDMLSGRYPSDEFADLRPRLTWDRLAGTLIAREGAKRVAVINGGTIPDRGLYGVFLIGERGPAARVGELDEEMVFESRVGETFLLGASTLAHRGDHARPGAGVAGAGRAGQDAVLEGRRGRPAAGARAAHRRDGARPAAACRPPRAVERLMQHHDLESAGGREPAALPRRPGRRRRRRSPTTARS